jgi:hypothetical protein
LSKKVPVVPYYQPNKKPKESALNLLVLNSNPVGYINPARNWLFAQKDDLSLWELYETKIWKYSGFQSERSLT